MDELLSSETLCWPQCLFSPAQIVGEEDEEIVYFWRHKTKWKGGEDSGYAILAPNCENMQNSSWIKSACDSMTGNKDGKFHPGAIKSRFEHIFSRLAHTHLVS